MSTQTPTPRTDGALIHKSSSSPIAYISPEFARTLERELSDMQARAEAAESKLADFERAQFGPDCEIEKLTRRAEAAEAACKIKEDAFAQLKARSACGQDGMCLTECKECKIIREAIATSPAETRSVIAGLRDEVAKIKAEYEEAKRLYMENDDKAVEIANEACALEAQLAALISIGNDMKNWCNEEARTAWQAAVSGAQTGAKGQK